MPIRTHRGRAAVYRRLWGWPLRSPKHLVGALVLLAAVATGIGYLLPEAATEPDSTRSRVTGDRSSAESGTDYTVSGGDTPSPPTITVPSNPPEPAKPDPKGLAVVKAWGKQWVNHPKGTTSREWLDRLRPYTTEEFISVMATVNPANIAADKITGKPKPVKSTATSMRVRLRTNTGSLKVHVIRTPEGWRVAGYDKGA